VIEPGGDGGAAGDEIAATAFDDQAVFKLLALHTASLQPLRHHSDPVGFLHPQFLDPARGRAALREGGRNEQHRIFIDHAGRAVRRYVDASERTVADVEIGDRFAANGAFVQQINAPAHRLQHSHQPGAGGVQANIANDDVATRHDQRGDHREGG